MPATSRLCTRSYLHAGAWLKAQTLWPISHKGAPLKVERIAADYQGATFYFATSAHRDLFISQPEAYAPQYGGYCAWAVSNGYTASITPEAFRIVEGKLYLNYSLRIQKQWDADRDNRIILADRNWPCVGQ